MYIIRYKDTVTACKSIGTLLDTIGILAMAMDSAIDDEDLYSFSESVVSIQKVESMYLTIHKKVKLKITYLQPTEVLIIDGKQQSIISIEELPEYLEKRGIVWDGSIIETTPVTTTKGYLTLLQSDGIAVYRGYRVDN